MAVKTFTTGEVLTAANTNTYLANAGLVYVASGALSTSSTLFQNVFTSTYTNYRIVFDSIQVSTAADIYYRFLNGASPAVTTNYEYAYLGLTTINGTANTFATGDSYGFTGISITGAGVGGIIFATGTLDVFGPQLVQRSLLTSASAGVYGGTYGFRNGMSVFGLTTAFDGISFHTRSAATMSGNVTIYGYRKA